MDVLAVVGVICFTALAIAALAYDAFRHHVNTRHVELHNRVTEELFQRMAQLEGRQNVLNVAARKAGWREPGDR